MAKGLFLGLTAVDIFNTMLDLPGTNCKIKALWQGVFAGGPATNAAVAYAALGNDSHLCSGLGHHPVARIARDDILDHGVTFHDCALEPDNLPILATILVNMSTGDRIVVYRDAEDFPLAETCPKKVLLDGVSVLLLDGFALPQAIRMAEEARRRGIATVLDGGSWKKGLERLLPMVAYAICSADFYPPGCRKAQEVFEFLSRYGVGKAAISRGGEPVIMHQAGKTDYLSVPFVDAIDTLGAGDILHGAFCHYICHQDFAASLRSAVQIASLSCRYCGPREWIRYLRESGTEF